MGYVVVLGLRGGLFGGDGSLWSLGSHLEISERKCRVSSILAIGLNLRSEGQEKKIIPSCSDLLLSPVLQSYLVTLTLLRLLVTFKNICLLVF